MAASDLPELLELTAQPFGEMTGLFLRLLRQITLLKPRRARKFALGGDVPGDRRHSDGESRQKERDRGPRMLQADFAHA